ncbi:glycoside hydrolase superfamily [Chytridium lagenaria]|nr:glycoside hydrolase superfamily [Chytridium lagenaria]
MLSAKRCLAAIVSCVLAMAVASDAAAVNFPGTFQVSLDAPTGLLTAALDNSWAVNYGANGARMVQHGITVGSTTRVVFTFNSVTKVTTTAVGPIDPPPPPPPPPPPQLNVNVAGDFQTAVGCPTNWNADCISTNLNVFDAAASTYSRSVPMVAGSYSFKITVGGSWAINYGVNGAPNGANIPLVIPATPSNAAIVTFTWNSVTKVASFRTVYVIVDPPPPPPSPSPTQPITSVVTTTTAEVPTTTTTAGPVGPGPVVPDDLPGCTTFTGDSCAGSQTDLPASSDERRWQTPPRGNGDWSAGFQDYRDLTGYADTVYSDNSRTSATVTVIANSRTNAALSYTFNGISQTSNTFRVTNSVRDGLKITVKAGDATLVLDTLYFVWDTPAITNRPETQNGQKGAIVELFGWPFKDVAAECEFLGKAGYMGVRVWAPMSISLATIGSRARTTTTLVLGLPTRLLPFHLSSWHLDDIRNMTKTCHSFGVRVYADAVINHMVGGGNDVQNHRRADNTFCAKWGPKNGTAGSPFYTHSNTFQFNKQTGLRPAAEFPAVPWSPSDFHCDRSLNSYDAFTMNYGYLSGLFDLNTEKANVQDRLATYLHPSSIPYNFYRSFDGIMSSKGLSSSDISKVKIWSSDYPKEAPVCGSWLIPPSRFVIQNDDHDQQNEGSSSRDMQDFGSVLIKDKDVPRHRSFEVKLFNARSENPDRNANGFPDGLSDCSAYKGNQVGCAPMPFRSAYVKLACGYSVSQNGQWIEGEYTRVHRDLSIINAMRSWMGLGQVNANGLGIPGCQ